MLTGGDTAARARIAAPAPEAGRLPANPLIWVLIVSEVAAFAAALAGFSVARMLDPATFGAGVATLDPPVGAANTAILLTSGAFAAWGLDAARLRHRRSARLWLALAAALGAAFVAAKIVEYAGKVALGHTIESDAFFTLYYLITGFHLAHAIFGVGVLLLVAAFCEEENVETGVAFWHMVDLVWVLVFPVFYLAR